MRHFDEQLQLLLRKVVLMGSVAEHMIQTAIRGLMERNEGLAADVFSQERELNTLQVEVDDAAVKLTALQQPVASDVRFLFMASRIGGELERIGDLAINVCQNTKYVLEAPPLKPIVSLPTMAELAQRMVRDSMSAMINRDVRAAESVLEIEEKVDDFRDQIFRTLLTFMMADPGTIQRALSLILIARNLERIGDHATNIAEEVIYWIQGRDVRHGGIKKVDLPTTV
ncbi:MAG TPA: phosphate signaling complex protein PhoU [Tepidisphaeraceae bacterium]|jgi:phosphate transport system protein